MKSYTIEDALSLARNLIHGPLPPKDAPTPTIDEAIAAIEVCRKRTDFNWITGETALEVLRSASKRIRADILAAKSRKTRQGPDLPDTKAEKDAR